MFDLITIAQQSSSSSGGALGAIVGLFFSLLWLAVIVALLAGLWKLFVKAGHPGWAALVPFYNIYILCLIAGRPWWWMLLLLVPILNFVVSIVLALDIAKSFGKDVLYGLGLAFLAPIFYPILGFGTAKYQGPSAAGKLAFQP